MKLTRFLIALVTLIWVSCECPYQDELDRAQQRKTTGDVFYADVLLGTFEGAAYLREIYLPETVSFIGEDAFAGCTSLQGIYYGESTPSAVRGIEAKGSDNDAEEVARYNLSGRPCSPNEKGVQIIVYSDFTIRTVIPD